MAVYFEEETFWVSVPKTCGTITNGNPIELIKHDWRNEWR